MARCRSCDAPITFATTAAGKLMPQDADGTPHFATCPVRKRLSLPDDVCLRCGSRTVERGPGSGQHYASLRCRDCRSHRWLARPV